MKISFVPHAAENCHSSCEECHLGNPVPDYSLFALHRMCNLESLIEKSKRRELASCLLLHSSIATRTRVSAGEVIKGNTGVNSRVTPESGISRCASAVPN